MCYIFLQKTFLICSSVVIGGHAEKQQEHFDHLEEGSDEQLASGDYLGLI